MATREWQSRVTKMDILGLKCISTHLLMYGLHTLHCTVFGSLWLVTIHGRQEEAAEIGGEGFVMRD